MYVNKSDLRRKCAVYKEKCHKKLFCSIYIITVSFGKIKVSEIQEGIEHDWIQNI